MAAAFVSVETGFDSYSVTVPSGSDRLLVVIAYSASATTGGTATYGGVAMTVATNSNDWVHIFYTLDPPVGAATLAITHGDLNESIAMHYTGVDSFQAASTGGTASASFSPTGAGVVVFGLSAASSGHTPAASCNERYDNTNEWACDRIVASSGAVTVGATSATTPDYAGAIFLEPSGTVHTATAAFTAQSASSAATVLRARSVDAAFTAQAATAAATAVLGHPASATFAAQSATMAATGTVVGNKTATASFTAQAASAAATASHGLPASAAFQAQSAASVVTVSVVGTKTLTAAFTAQSATMAATVSAPNLPGTATARVTTAGTSAVATSDPTALAGAAGSSSVSTSSPTAAVQAGRGTSSVIG